MQLLVGKTRESQMKVMVIGICLVAIVAAAITFIPSKDNLPEIAPEAVAKAVNNSSAEDTISLQADQDAIEDFSLVPEKSDEFTLIPFNAESSRHPIFENNTAETIELQDDFKFELGSVAHQRFKDMFLTGEDDGNVSYLAENYYISMLAEEERLSVYALSEADCKTDICKITFSVSNDEQKALLLDDLVNSLITKNQNISISFNAGDQPGFADIYLEVPKDLGATQ